MHRPERRTFLGLGLDLRYTWRGLRRRPVFSTVIVVVVALGVGATTSMFSMVDAILLRALPFAQPERLVAIMPGQFTAGQDADALRRRMTAVDLVATFSPGWLMALVEIDEPRQVNAAKVSANLFSMLGARPMIGTMFGPEAEANGGAPVVALGHALWRDVFHGDSAIIGRSIALEGGRSTVVAVMPADFQLMDSKTDLWMPMPSSPGSFTWTGASSLLFGRLRDGSTIEGAAAELRSILPSVISDFGYPADWGAGAAVVSMHESLVGNVRRMLWLLFGGVVCLLAIATSNVATLLMVRASERRSELALRVSLGAPRGRIARLLGGESLVLGLAGGGAGAVLAVLVLRVLPGLLPPDLPRLGEIAMNGRVLGFALLAALGPTAAFALAPVVYAGRTLAPRLREQRGGGAGGERARGGLVALQVSLTLVLLVGASIMGRSLLAMLRVDRGLRTDHLLTARVTVGKEDPEAVLGFWREGLAAIQAIPGVTGAATVLHLPTSGRSWRADVEVAGRPLSADAPRPRVAWQAVSSDYFATAGVPILAGRPFSALDDASADRVVAVNAAFAQRVFPGESPLGRKINAGNATNREHATIVAVVGGVRHDSLSAPPGPEIYVPIEQRVVFATGLVVRTTGDPSAVAGAVRERLWSQDRNIPVTDMRSMDELFEASLQRPRMILWVLGLFAAVGLTIGVVGVYGVVAFGAQQRTREFGIRAALGADGAALRRQVLGAGLRYSAIGVGIGVILALGLSNVVRGMVFGVSATDPVSFGIVTFVLVVATLLAAWAPARRASRLDPAVTLRDG